MGTFHEMMVRVLRILPVRDAMDRSSASADHVIGGGVQTERNAKHLAHSLRLSSRGNRNIPGESDSDLAATEGPMRRAPISVQLSSTISEIPTRTMSPMTE